MNKLPWKLDSSGTEIVTDDERETPILAALESYGRHDAVTAEQAREHARFAVRACNNFDTMCEALEAITLRTAIMGSTGDYRAGQLDALEACSAVARAALAAAREEKVP